MALQKDQRLIGGGKLYFERLVDGVLQEKKEIGEVKDFKITANITTAEVEALESAVAETLDSVVIKQDYTLSFTTNQVDKDTLLLALFGKVEQKTYKQGDTLPDGTVAAADTTYNVIQGGIIDGIMGRLTFVADSARGKKKVAVFYKVSLSLNGDLLLQSKDFVTIPFTAKVLKDTSVTEGSPYFAVYEEA